MEAKASYLLMLQKVISLNCNGSESFLFINATKIYQFKAKSSEIKDDALSLGNFSKDFTIGNMKKIGLIFFCRF